MRPGNIHSLIQLRMSDLTVLLDNIYRGAELESIGFEDADNTIARLCARMERTISLVSADVESGLWSCNLMNEAGKFWHPRGDSFDQWLKKALPNHDFHRIYNYLNERKQNA